MKRTNRLAMLLLAGLLLTAAAALAGVEDLPGYIDLKWIEIPNDAEEVQDIDLGTVLLGVAADAEEAGDGELATALKMIKSIRVKAFSTGTVEPEKIQKMVIKVQGMLDKKDWERLIYVKDNEEILTVSTKYEDGDMVGLMVVAFEEGQEVAFVNVVGNLDLATLMRIGLGMDELDLDELMENIESSDR